MDWLIGVDWGHLLAPDTPLLEIFIRGSMMYVGLFILLRVILKRQTGSVSMSDVLLIVLLADAAQNAMADDYTSITDGLLLVTTLVFWNYVIDWAGYHIPAVQRLVHPGPLLLVQDGRLLRHNMRQELMTREELMSQLREQGIEDLASVKTAYMEGDGQVSVIPVDGQSSQPKRERTDR